MSTEFVFRLDAWGIAHICRVGYVTALCGAQGRHRAERATPCPTCMELATIQLADDERTTP